MNCIIESKGMINFEKLVNVNVLFYDFAIYMILTRFCEKLRVLSSDFSLIKNIVVTLPFSILPIK